MLLRMRAMTLTDISQVYDIEKRAHRLPWTQEILRDCVTVGYDCRVIHESESPLILGYSICRQAFKLCHILNLCVDPQHQGQGIGHFLLKEILNHPQNPMIDTYILEVRPSNQAAITLYSQFGFSKDSVKLAYYKDAQGYEDAWLFKKTINKKNRDDLSHQP